MSGGQDLIYGRAKNRAKSLIARAITASERRLARQAIWMNTTWAIRILGGIATMSLTARIIGVEGLGVLAAIAAVSAFIYGLTDIRNDVALITFVSQRLAAGRAEDAARIFRFVLATSLALALAGYAIIAFAAFTAGGLLDVVDREHRDLLLLYGVGGILISTHDVSLALLQLADRMRLYAIVAAASMLIRFCLLTTIWLADGGIIHVVLVHIAESAFSGLALFTAAVLSAPLAGLAGLLRWEPIKIPGEVTRFYTGSFWLTKVNVIVDNMDVILLTQFTGAAGVGLYEAARRIARMAADLIGSIRTGLLPEYSRLWHSGQGVQLRRLALRISILSFVLFGAGFGAAAVFGAPIIRILLGNEFIGATPPLLILMLHAFPNSTLQALLLATGRIWSGVLTRMVGLAAFLAVMMWLAPEHGATGAAWARSAFPLATFIAAIPFVVAILRQSYRLRPRNAQQQL